MKNNKAADGYGLCAEHFKIAGNVYHRALALCYNTMFTHGNMPPRSLSAQLLKIQEALLSQRDRVTAA